MQHEIRLIGPALRADRIDGRLLKGILDPLVEGAQGAVRLLVEGRSRARAPKPAWLQRDASFDFVPVTGGKATQGAHVFGVEASTLRGADPDRFSQVNMFGEKYAADRSGIDLLEDALEAALRGDRDSDLYDEALLDTLLGLKTLFALGVERVEVVNGRTVPLTDEGLDAIAALRRQTPPPQQVRVAGMLDLLEASTCRFMLLLADGLRMGGVAEGVSEEDLRALWKKTVTVTGKAYFHASGRVRRLEADAIRSATEVDQRAFASLPTPLFGTTDARRFHVKAGPEDGLNAIFEKWPDEDDSEETDRAIEALQ